MGERPEKEEQLEELLGDQNLGPEAPPGSRKGSKGYARGAMEKGRYVRIIEGEEVRRDDPVEYFLPGESDVPLEFQKG